MKQEIQVINEDGSITHTLNKNGKVNKLKTPIVALDPKDFQIEEKTASQIAAQFRPMLDKMEELEEEFNQVISLDLEEKETSNKAYELRQKYVKVRTGTAEIHKQQKAFYLAGGRFVDGWKKAQEFASFGKEEKLKAIENYAEQKRKAEIEQLQKERMALIYPYLNSHERMTVDSIKLGEMSDDFWNKYFTGAKTNFEAAELLKKTEAEATRVAEEEAAILRAELEAEKRKNAALLKEKEQFSAPVINESKPITTVTIEPKKNIELITKEPEPSISFVTPENLYKTKDEDKEKLLLFAEMLDIKINTLIEGINLNTFEGKTILYQAITYLKNTSLYVINKANEL